MLDHLRLGGGSTLAVSRDEADALIAHLNAHFDGEVVFDAPTPERWYARFAEPVGCHTTALDAARGRPVQSCLPSGPDAPRLRRLQNEIQMLLHTHPVNARREAQGQEAINSLWIWGGGMQASQTHPEGTNTLVWSDSPDLCAWGEAGGFRTGVLPDAFRELGTTIAPTARTLIVIDQLHPLSCDGRIADWQAALQQLDGAWFAPALEALRRGRYSEIRLDIPGEPGKAYRLSRLGNLRVWRRPGRPCP